MLRKVRSSQAAAILGLNSVPPGQSTNLQVTDLWLTNPAHLFTFVERETTEEQTLFLLIDRVGLGDQAPSPP